MPFGCKEATVETAACSTSFSAEYTWEDLYNEGFRVGTRLVSRWRNDEAMGSPWNLRDRAWADGESLYTCDLLIVDWICMKGIERFKKYNFPILQGSTFRRMRFGEQ